MANNCRLGSVSDSITLGIDFDNTIVTYDNVFYKYALKFGLISAHVRKNKKDIRDNIRLLSGGNEKWTELQGLVYGCYMNEAEPAKGIEQFLRICKGGSVKILIISHKTVYPVLGPHVNLRESAKKWLLDRGFLSELGLSESDIIFTGTLEAKLTKIVEMNCTHFIDDLVEVLQHPNFPSSVERILYLPSGEVNLPGKIRRFKAWGSIQRYFFC